MKWGKTRKEILRSYPRLIDATLLTLTMLHALLALTGQIPDIWHALSDSATPDRTESLYTGALGAAATVSGFSGVVVIFALTANGKRFQKLRVLGGKALKSNWISSTSSGFFAVLAFTLANLLSLLNCPSIAPYIFQAGFLLLAHSSIRLVWLLGELTEIVIAADRDAIKQARQVSSTRELHG
ncbi:hypothetical protein KBX14_00015 [Corynebacterium sp. CCUG 61414]|uniref:hypothetical protein n=1 Tax=Corynebacterium sp. CCUG 61414 TaxID=2823896 RepID=UPI00210EEB1F|nr:hypothetical protein [Corynebacterium sp. CCUG 61414]MCQ4608813.1 hypothetical protein [Corynebacterium sp. CCUG 61414]